MAALKAEFGEDALAGLDLEGDFDEAKHEAAVQQLMAGDDDDVRIRDHADVSALNTSLYRRNQHGMMKIWICQRVWMAKPLRNCKNGMRQKKPRESRCSMMMKVP